MSGLRGLAFVFVISQLILIVLPVQAGVSVRHAVAAILVTAVLLHLSTVTRQGFAIAPPAQ